MRLQLVMLLSRAQVTFFIFTLGAVYNREPPQEREPHINHKFKLATLPVYYAFH